MTKNAVELFKDSLPVPTSEYLDALRMLAGAAAQGGGNPFMKMGKDGKWVYGAEEIDVSPKDEWVVNPNSFRAGVVGWANGQKVGEEMYIVGTGVVDKSKLPPIVGGKQGDGWQDQLSVDLYSFEHDVTVTFSTSSAGGKKAIGLLAGEVAKNPGKLPVVNCLTSHYMHKQYGKTYVPEFKVIRFEEPKRKLV